MSQSKGKSLQEVDFQIYEHYNNVFSEFLWTLINLTFAGYKRNYDFTTHPNMIHYS